MFSGHSRKLKRKKKKKKKKKPKKPQLTFTRMGGIY
jgi:hypothetical protein